MNSSKPAIVSMPHCSLAAAAAPARASEVGAEPGSRPSARAVGHGEQDDAHDDDDVAIDLSELLDIPEDDPTRDPNPTDSASDAVTFLPALQIDEDYDPSEDAAAPFEVGIEIQLPDDLDAGGEGATLDIGFVPAVDDDPEVGDTGEDGPTDRFALDAELPPLEQEQDSVDAPWDPIRPAVGGAKPLLIAAGPTYHTTFTVNGSWQAIAEGLPAVWAAGSHLDQLDEAGNTRRLVELDWAPNDLFVANDGAWALLASAAGRLLRVDLPTGNCHQLLPLPGAISVRLLQDGSTIWAFDPRAGLFRVDHDGQVFTPTPLERGTIDLSEGSGEFALCGSAGGQLEVRRQSNGERITRVGSAPRLWSRAGRLLLLSDEGQLSFFDTEGSCRQHVELGHQVLSAALAPGPGAVCWLALRERDGTTFVAEFSTLLGKARVVHADPTVLDEDDDCRLLYCPRAQLLYVLSAGRLTALRPDRSVE